MCVFDNKTFCFELTCISYIFCNVAHYRRSRQTGRGAAVTRDGSVKNSQKPFAHDIEPLQFTMTILFIARALISEHFEVLGDWFTYTLYILGLCFGVFLPREKLKRKKLQLCI